METSKAEWYNCNVIYISNMPLYILQASKYHFMFKDCTVMAICESNYVYIQINALIMKIIELIKIFEVVINFLRFVRNISIK